MVAFVGIGLAAAPADAQKCGPTNECLCVAQNASHAALRVLPSSVNVGFVNVSEVVRAGDCSYSVGDSFDLSSEVDDDEAFAAYPELLVGLDCNANLRGFVVLDDESASCSEGDFDAGRDDALTVNASEDCLTEVDDVLPDAECDSADDGCCSTTRTPSVPTVLVLGLLLGLVLRRRR